MTVKQEIKSCTACELHKVGKGPVPYRGRSSRIMVVGEAPGRKEDEYGKPFVGPAGRLLWTELAKVGIERANVFAANAVCCWPKRTPSEDEMYACRGNLYRQVRLCQPEWVLALGKTANFSLGGTRGGTQGIGVIHGEAYPLGWYEEEVMVFPTYHPAAVLRNKLLTRTWRTDLKSFADKVVHRVGVVDE